MRKRQVHPSWECDAFDKVLSAPSEDLEFELRAAGPVPWADFFLNPRRLRGSDFLMRWSQGVWSEERIIQAVNESNEYFALAYGPSSVAPDDNPREFELYFERLERAGLGRLKRPDLLIFQKADQPIVDKKLSEVGGLKELPFTPEDEMEILLSRAILAVECENSLWRASQMPGFGSSLTPQKRLGGLPGLKKTAVVPTVIIKEEDRVPLLEWERRWNVDLHVWHVFYDMAFGLSFMQAEELIDSRRIEPTDQTFQAPGGATTRKVIYKFYYHYAYPVGTAVEEPKLVPAQITDNNGHILPYVRFEGGTLKLSREALGVLRAAKRRADGK
ncbi:MAG: AccI family restriction endonuclease [Chloroflexi bacterium]|nr:AccI family restriction endonuclease [Chloroflexota bacterium]